MKAFEPQPAGHEAPIAEQRLRPGTLPRHRHRHAYAAIVLEGGYLEVGDRGCWRVEAGDLVAHSAFESHLDTVPANGARVLNLALGEHQVLPPVFRVADLDALVRAARTDPLAAAAGLAPVETRPRIVRDWPDVLAEALLEQPSLRIGDWAAASGLAPATVSRGFKAAFGTSAARYRTEARTLVAWRRIREGGDPLAAIAQDCGFADQAHLTRAIALLTGGPPRAWRQVKKIQDRAAGAA